MGKLTTALVFVLALNVLMFLAQASTMRLNPNTYTEFWTNDDSMIDHFDKDGTLVLDTEAALADLPEGKNEVNPDTGELFTDTFTSIKQWIAEKTGLNYLYTIIAAPYSLLVMMNLPPEICLAFGVLWYAVTFFLIVAFFLGRDV